ncbi:MAG: GyrI-like domain-containing protein [Anaerolineaceae bacterium]
MSDQNMDKKVYKKLYSPKSVPAFIQVPRMRFVVIEGKGDPNGEEFGIATSALYSFSYAVKMSYKSKSVPQGYYEYKVFPLEGEWDLDDKSKPLTDKSNYKYRIMIRQPDFLTTELFTRFLQETNKKKPNKYLEKMGFEKIEEGLCCQMLHIGRYDDEPASFERMEAYCSQNGYERSAKTHREVYLNDPRRTDPSKLKTILRYRVTVCRALPQ